MHRLLTYVSLALCLTSSALAQTPETWALEPEEGVRVHGESYGPYDRPGDRPGDREAPYEVLFLHGGPAYPPMRLPGWLRALAQTHRVHLFHQRGSGRSSRPIERLPEDEALARALLVEVYGIERLLLDIDAIAEARFGERPFALVGHSFGGALAALYAARRPDRVERLALLAPASVLDGELAEQEVFRVIEEALDSDDRGPFRSRLTEFLEPGTLAGRSDAELALRSDWFGWAFLKALGMHVPRPDSYPQMTWSGGAAVTGGFLSLARREAGWSELESISAPTLVLHGARDLMQPEVTAAFADAIPTADFEVLEAASHFFDEDAAGVASRLRDWLRR